MTRALLATLLLVLLAPRADAQLSAETHLRWSAFAGALGVESIDGLSAGGGLSARLVRENAPFDLAFDGAVYRFPPVRVKQSGYESQLDQSYVALSATVIVQRPGSRLQLLGGAGTYWWVYDFTDNEGVSQQGTDRSVGYHLGVGYRIAARMALEVRFVNAQYAGYDDSGSEAKVRVRMVPIFLRLAL
ncbi:MAG: hypothetical protein P3A32_05355 [Gemmatimonadota bacterium]|nr:hypothetical protein [Gemmatimonadota bacterium]MDQ8149239.1 hypothetical protein [Gemmatimonadota bacterium]MDQ8176842.1 hypothetical protein [Gemmatimonadota bacterium]